MSSPAPRINRPLSPFMIGPYYKPQLTSMLSIAHRIAGVGLSVGSLGLAWWLVALASGPWQYAAFAKHVDAWYGQVVMLGFSWALLYHLCNGIRHLVWDLGYGYSIPVLYRSGIAVIVASLVLTGAAWGVAYVV